MLLASSFSRHTLSSSSFRTSRRLLANFLVDSNKKACSFSSLSSSTVFGVNRNSLILSQPSPSPQPLFNLNTLIFLRKMSTTQPKQKLAHLYENIIRSSQDKRVYRAISLDNGIKCLLVSDPMTDRSAASLDVNAGYLLDPAEFPGLAHFCEHMLFMGSKKYSGENVFMKFIEDHAGSSNAYTSTENTNYHFEVATTHFKEALDIFAQFFISPLFDSSSTERELNAVDSENQKNLQSDAWRLDQLEKSTSNPAHPFSKFGTGNLQTLKIEPESKGLSVREELLKFHSKYYSANLMTLSLLGKESLDELQQYAVDMFSDIPNKSLPEQIFDPQPYTNDALATRKYVTPVQDLRNMSITWTIPDYREHTEANPVQYISHLVGHEGPGSLLSELKRRGWANSLYSGGRREARGFQFFNITLDLSEEGGEKCDDIVMLVYQYLNMLRREKPAEWIYDELNNLGKISFNFKDKEKPINFVSSIVSDMHLPIRMENILTANYYLNKFEPDLIASVYEHLVPEKMRITILSKKYQGQTDRVEKWYGTEYKIEKIEHETLKKLNECGLNEAFRLPSPNTFIPTNFDLVKHNDETSASNKPRVIHSTPLSRLWYKEDTKFLLPKAVFKFELRNPLVYLDPVNVNMANLYVDLLKDSLNEYSYMAELAGLKYTVSATNYGLNLGVSGFSDKMDVLLETVVERMATLKIDPQRFAILKESYTRALTNFDAEQPYKHAVYYVTLLISEKGWSKQQLLDTINSFTIDDLQSFIPKLLTQNVFIESLVFGNVTHERARQFMQMVESKLTSGLGGDSNGIKLRPLCKSQRQNLRQIQLPDSCNYVFLKNNNVHKTTSVECYYQCGMQSTRDNAIVELFCQVINESSFNVLRTQEQLGYIVASGVRNFGGAQGVRLIVQSDKSPAFLDERIENFLHITRESIEKMSDEEFQTHVQALITTKLEEPKKMSKQGDIYWNEISSHQYHFDREQNEVDEIKKLTKEELHAFFKTYICVESKTRRKLSTYIYPTEMNAELNKDTIKDKCQLVEDLSEWHRYLPLYPLAKPYMKIE